MQRRTLDIECTLGMRMYESLGLATSGEAVGKAAERATFRKGLAT